MKVYLIGWGLIVVAVALSLGTLEGKEVEIETYASWILYTVGLVLVSAPRKHKMFENIR
ncbi:MULTISPECIES: hypothetical protein [Alcanivorax]|uniref:hypothetical protein n=1 Tax=Alcanivorax TaxID=59753 RepID=UPI0025BA4274|nr:MULTISPECIES: hypothetical protein [Alcanivorax]MCK5885253.1 hypothetical protein [Alcanivorax sp.]MCK5923293.1 hypothetical protein [Methylococcales bacterium]